MSRSPEGKLILWAHPYTRISLDYGDELGRDHGLAWSPDGEPRNAGSVEWGDFEALLASKLDGVGPSDPVEIRRGEPVVRKSDMNPHGLI